MWRRRGSISGSSSTTQASDLTSSNSITNGNGTNYTATTTTERAASSSSMAGRLSEGGGSTSAIAGLRNSFFGSDPRAADRPLVFSVEVPAVGPLGLDLRARHVERDRPQRGAVVKGFRPVQHGRKGFVEDTGRVRIGDILQIIHQTYIDDMPFEQIVKHAMQLQQQPDAWPLKLEFRREQASSSSSEAFDDSGGRPRRSSFFRSSVTTTAAPDTGTFNEKLQYFRGFFANKIPTGGAAPKAKEKGPMPAPGTVNEMYRDLLVKRGVPDDVMDELVRIESLDNKWHVVWYAQQNESDDHVQSSIADAKRVAESLVELNWDNKGLKELEALRNKISTSSSEWVEAFLARFGLDYLTMKLPDPSPFPVENSKFEKATRMCDTVLRILRSITHHTAGVEAITNVPGLVKRVALCFHTDNGDLKKHTLQLLGIVCYNSAAGHQAVIEAFDHYKDTKGESIRFSCLRDALKSTRYSLGFKEDVLSFVNIIVNKAIRLEDRLAIRSDFIALKMATYFEEIRAKSQAVQRQKFPSFSAPVDGAGTSSSVKNDTAPSSPVRRESGQFTANHASQESAASTSAAAASLGAAVKAQLEASLRTTSFQGNSERRQSQSRSAPSSPRERDRTSSTDFDRFSVSSSRQSIPSITDDGVVLGNARASISSSVTQLRSQLDSMEKQIEVFERFMEDDRKDTIFEQTDLSSAESVFKSLWQNVSSDPELQACMLSVLQQLLFIPGDRVIGKEMWALAERLMKQIALLSPVEEVRNFEMGYDDRKAVLRLRDKYTEFLQKCADEDPTFRFHVGPIIVIENRKPESAEELLMSDPDTADETDDEDLPERISARDHPELMKYFKLLKMGMPMAQVQLKMQSEITSFDISILENPDQIISTGKEEPAGIRADQHEKYAKFFKLLKMGMPVPHVQLKMKADGLNELILETPEMLLDDEGNEWKEPVKDPVGIPVREHEKFAKYFKLMKMGMQLEHIKLKASADGVDGALLDTPDALLDEEGNIFVPAPKGIPVKEHEKFVKFFKLMKMGMPIEQIKLKASAEGLDASLLDSPDELLNEDGTKFTGGALAVVGVPAKEHEKYAKFFKLLKMGMPLEQIKLKVSSEGLHPEMLDTPNKLLDPEGKEVVAEKEPGVPAKEHEKFTKFFKLLKMGMPIDHVKLKVSSEGLDPAILDSPDMLLDADGKEIKEPVMGTPVSEHEKFAKFFKLLKMGMPLDHVKLKASAEGLDPKLLETPDALVDADGREIKSTTPVRDVKVSEHPMYAKYFKLLKMGMPRPQMELKMAAEGLDAKLLDTPDAMIPESAPESDTSPKKPTLPPPPPKPKLRNLYWDTVQETATSGTIWEEFTEQEASPSANPVASLFAKPVKKDRVLDKYVDQLADIFVNKPPKAKEEAKKTAVKKRAPTRVALIDVKRANNIGIMLARFRLPYEKIKNAILEVDKELLSSEKLSALIQFAPEDAELDAVKAYTGNPKLLGDAEQYFRVLLDVPRISTRLQAIHATWQFDSYVEEQTRLVESVRSACAELKQCGRLREIFKVVLTLGNALNDGTARGGAKGFRLSILLKLNQVKASDNSITLLNYVAQLLRSKDPAILNFNEELPSVESASRVTTQVLKAGESAVRKAATLICDELDEHTKLTPKDEESKEGDDIKGEANEKEDESSVKDCFQDAIRPFAERAKLTSERIQLELDAVMRSFEQTVSFYGEDPASPDCGPDAFFSIFYSFAKLLQTADRDNERRRITEERRIRREEETKKRLEMLKNKKKNTSFASLKDGDVDDIMSKIRAKRVAEKRKELLETSFEDAERLRSSSRTSANSQTPRSANGTMLSTTSSTSNGAADHAPSSSSGGGAKSDPHQPAVEVVSLSHQRVGALHVGRPGMAEFVAYARALRREIDGFLATSRLRVAPSLALVDCGCQPRHFVPVTSLDDHTRTCHGHRYYATHSSHEFFYRNEAATSSAIASHTHSEHTPVDDTSNDITIDSLVEPATTIAADEAAELATCDVSQEIITAVKALATHAAALYAVVQPWRYVPRAFVRLPLGDDSDLSALLKPKLERWIKAELARRHDEMTVAASDNDGVDLELLEYMLGLLDHPEFCHPDLIAVELEEFLGASDVKTFVLALWKFVVVEIGIHVLPAAAPSSAIAVESRPKSNGSQSLLESPRTERESNTTERAPPLKRRRPTYRAKSTRAGPYDMVREILAGSMAQLSQETGRKLVTTPVVVTPAMGVSGMETGRGSRSRTCTPAENWSEYTDALLVRDRARRRREPRERKDGREDYHEPNRRRSRSPPSRRSHRSDRRRRSRTRSRSRSRERSSHRHHDRHRDRESSHNRPRDRQGHDRVSESRGPRDGDRFAHQRSPPRGSGH